MTDTPAARLHALVDEFKRRGREYPSQDYRIAADEVAVFVAEAQAREAEIQRLLYETSNLGSALRAEIAEKETATRLWNKAEAQLQRVTADLTAYRKQFGDYWLKGVMPSETINRTAQSL